MDRQIANEMIASLHDVERFRQAKRKRIVAAHFRELLFGLGFLLIASCGWTTPLIQPPPKPMPTALQEESPYPKASVVIELPSSDRVSNQVDKVAVTGETVEGLIEGVVLDGDQPVQGARIWSCNDKVPGRHKENCNTLAVRLTDANGRFSFKTTTGYSAPTQEECRKTKACHRDRNWSYWFSLEAGKTRFSNWIAGVDYGPTYARVVCDLAKDGGNCDHAEIRFPVDIRESVGHDLLAKLSTQLNARQLNIDSFTSFIGKARIDGGFTAMSNGTNVNSKRIHYISKYGDLPLEPLSRIELSAKWGEANGLLNESTLRLDIDTQLACISKPMMVKKFGQEMKREILRVEFASSPISRDPINYTYDLPTGLELTMQFGSKCASSIELIERSQELDWSKRDEASARYVGFVERLLPIGVAQDSLTIKGFLCTPKQDKRKGETSSLNCVCDGSTVSKTLCKKEIQIYYWPDGGVLTSIKPP